MESDMGPKVAAFDSFGCSNPRFLQYQFFPGQVCDGAYGARQVPKSGRFNLNYDTPCSPPSEHNFGSAENERSPSQWTSWNWDGVSFVARPPSEKEEQAGEAAARNREDESIEKANAAHLMRDSSQTISWIPTADLRVGMDVGTGEQKRKQAFPANESVSHLDGEANGDDENAEDAGSLTLNLGGSLYACSEDGGTGSRNSKRYCSSSPAAGGGSQYPMCQVDDCRADLTHAKDYHRRHKVCEMHSKASKALVHRLMQRFCQQCSRFHPLNEFDEIKRSCRRRLAGHNRRRRKSQPDVGATRVSSASDAVRGTDIVTILALLTRIQAAVSLEKSEAAFKDQEQLLQAIKKASTFSSVPGTLSQAAVGHAFDINCAGQPSAGMQKPDLKSQADLITALASCSPEAMSILLQNSLKIQASLVARKLQQAQSQEQLQHVQQSPNCGPSFVRGSAETQRRASEVTINHSNSLPAKTPLSQHSSLRSNCLSDPEKWSVWPDMSRQYLVPDRSRCTQVDGHRLTNLSERAGSLLTEQSLFPLQSGCESRTETIRSVATCGTDDMIPNSKVDTNKQLAVKTSEHWKWRDGEASRGLTTELQKPNQQGSDRSDSGSDQSPASSSSDWQERTERIIFKLFDARNPADLPQFLRAEILEWLAHTPSDMESFIRPGCIILTIFLTMPVHAWEELVTNLQESLGRFVACSHCGFWRKGRILVQVLQQRAFIINGKVRMTRFPSSPQRPRLRSVRPLAIVAGEETTFVVHGDNLVPGTKILCSYGGKYCLQEVAKVGRQQASINDTSACAEKKECLHEQVQRLHFPGVPRNVVGRCFIEVEHELTGDILPVIIADGAICSELQALEEELDAAPPRMSNSAQNEPHQSQESAFVTLRKEKAINFLHELGWFFQRNFRPISGLPCMESAPCARLRPRFKALLTYAVEHDWCAVVKKILDMLFDYHLSKDDGSSCDLIEIVSEVNPVHLAVKRKCKLMVELLLQYIPGGDEARGKLIFSPTMAGPGGLTPLHIAACLSNAREIVDALTSDPLKAGLDSWKNTRDALGQTPEWYALNSGNFSYIELVGKKLSSRRTGHVSIWIGDDRPRPEAHWNSTSAIQAGKIRRIEALNGMKVELPERRSHPLDIYSQPSKAFSTCRHCMRDIGRENPTKVASIKGTMYRPLVMSMVAIATLCVCVTLFLKGPPQVGDGYPFTWEEILFGSS